MKKGIIGYSGFVGTNLCRQLDFDERYNSKNIEEIAGNRFGLLVCAGAPAAKWKANQEPEADLANIQRLIRSLDSVTTDQLVLISTVDVYPRPIEVDEGSPIDSTLANAYGRHRKLLEDTLVSRFATTIIRLPGLFGRGLKKNIIFDLLTNNCVDQIDPRAVFQFYHLDNLWQDVTQAMNGSLTLVNFATEPLSAQDVASSCFQRTLLPKEVERSARYDFRSRHSARWGRNDGYLYGKEQILAEMRDFVRAWETLA